MIRHTGIVVKDLQTAIKCYQDLGFSTVSHASEVWNNKQLRITKMVDNNGGVLELIQPMDCLWSANHIALEVDSLERAAAMFPVKLQGREDQYAAVQYVEDDSGNVLELVEVKG